MSPMTTYTSRKERYPAVTATCMPSLTDLRNFRSVIPDGEVSDWEATEDRCSFKNESTGRLTVSLSEALPHSEINYEAESFFSGKVKIRISLEYLSSMRSAIRIDAGLNMNPLCVC